MRKLNLDAWYIGLAGGLIIPLITMVIFYFFRNIEDSFPDYLKLTFRYSILSRLISLAAIPDALLFFLFLRKDKIRSANGVILALFLIVIIVVLLKYVFS